MMLDEKFYELDNKIRKLILDLDTKIQIMSLSPEQRAELSILLEQWIRYLNEEDQRRQIGVINGETGEVVRVSDLPELVRIGNIFALKLLKVLFLT